MESSRTDLGRNIEGVEMNDRQVALIEAVKIEIAFISKNIHVAAGLEKVKERADILYKWLKEKEQEKVQKEWNKHY
jgi:hypothetical protein